MMPENCTAFAGPRANFPTMPSRGAPNTAQCLPAILLGRLAAGCHQRNRGSDTVGTVAPLQGLSHNPVMNPGAVPVAPVQQPVLGEGYRLGISTVVGATSPSATSSRVQAGHAPPSFPQRPPARKLCQV